MKYESHDTWPEIKIFNPTVFEDDRGDFFESFDEQVQEVFGALEFVQDNHSTSFKNVIRGLHYQWRQPMGKLVRVAHGLGDDVFVDIRKGSANYGKYGKVTLHSRNMLWIPPGFAHGFHSLSDNTVLLYKCTAVYNKDGEASINPFDKDIGIDWWLGSQKPIVSKKDKTAPSFKEYDEDPIFNI